MINSPSASEIYGNSILNEVPRVLSLMDREPYSPTLGCCDRVYWAWKFTDFPGARFQEALCTLGFLYATELQGNEYHASPKLLGWICDGLRYWSSIQYGDGSFDEAYPYERSLAATAFTTFYVGETLKFLDDALPSDVRQETMEAIKKAGTWLCNNDETHGFLSNHLAAATAALYHVYQLTGDDTYARRSRYFLEKILSHQSKEGWYDEYGSADPGYQTHGSFYLARYWQLSKSETLASSLSHSFDFIARFIHIDGSIGGEYASRNTQTYYPAAFEMFAPHDATASWIASSMRTTVMSGSAADLGTVDSYNFFPFLNNMVFAYLACDKNKTSTLVSPEEPGKNQDLAWYPDAGLARIRNKNYDIYIGTAKGGVIKVFDHARKKLVYSDCGYIGKLNNGRVFASQYLDKERKVLVDSNRIQISGGFSVISRPTMKPVRFIAFRSFMLSIGRFPAVAKWLKNYLVRVLIYRRQTLAIDFQRTITFDNQAITITDNISGADGKHIDTLRWSELFTTIHMGSSRYFIKNELNELASLDTKTITANQVCSGVTLTRVVSSNQ